MTSGASFFLSNFPLICTGLLVGASLRDIIGRTIPNGLALALALGGIAAQAAGGHIVGSCFAGGLVFLLAAGCWRLGWMGGGDVKLLGAAAAALPPHLVPLFIAAVAISGGLLACIYLGARALIAAPGPRLRLPLGRSSKHRGGLFARVARVERWRIHRGCPLPYACAIAAGFLFVTL
jgi:prepilin peptidase CpaA